MEKRKWLKETECGEVEGCRKGKYRGEDLNSVRTCKKGWVWGNLGGGEGATLSERQAVGHGIGPRLLARPSYWFITPLDSTFPSGLGFTLFVVFAYGGLKPLGILRK